ncbi:hypothetical protein GW758_03535 [Candidatus Falkowbacteria bacterium]|nr:hypothetical protein [Candidatus Falkowbacteria bacterium]
MLIAFVLLISACSQTSDWKKVVISKNDEVIFIDRDGFYIKGIAIPIENNDTVFISSSRLVERTCYLKMAYPDRSIVVEYVTISNKKGNKDDIRFVNIE